MEYPDLIEGQNPLVNLGKGEMAAEAAEIDALLDLLILRQQPMVAALANVMLHPAFGLRDQQILLQGGERSVVGEFGAAIMAFGGIGQDFDDQHRIQQGIDSLVFKAGFATGGDKVGVGVHAGLADLDAHVVGIDFTGFAPKLLVQAGGQTHAQKVGRPTGAGLGEDAAIQKFVSGFLPAFPGQIVLRGKEGLGLCAHAGVSAECSMPYPSMAEPVASGQNPGGDERQRNRPNAVRRMPPYAALIGATMSSYLKVSLRHPLKLPSCIDPGNS